VNLAWKLARVTAGAPKALLKTYDEERLPHAEEVLRETDRTTTLLFAPNAGLRLLRDSIVLPILRHPAFQRRMFGKFSQLHVHYRSSSLSHDGRPWWRRRRIRAGDRAPDVSFGDTRSGVRLTLFSLMRPLQPIVLFNGVSDSQTLSSRLGLLNIEAYELTAASTAEAAERQLVDVHGDFGALYHLRSEFLCLIRPDGHVGLVQEPFDETRLVEYLSHISAPSEVRRCFSAVE
jgi:FAD binding domain